MGKKCNSDQWWNNNKCRCKCKKRHVFEKDHIWNPAKCSCKNGKYLAIIRYDSGNTCDETIESHNKETNFHEKKKPVKHKISIFYLRFY